MWDHIHKYVTPSPKSAYSSGHSSSRSPKYDKTDETQAVHQDDPAVASLPTCPENSDPSDIIVEPTASLLTSKQLGANGPSPALSEHLLFIEPCQEALDYQKHDPAVDGKDVTIDPDTSDQIVPSKPKRNILKKMESSDTSQQSDMNPFFLGKEGSLFGKPSNIEKVASSISSKDVQSKIIKKELSFIDEKKVMSNQVSCSYDRKKLDSLNIIHKSFKDSVESPSGYDPRSGFEAPSSLDPLSVDMTSMDITSQFTSDNEVVARSGMARYTKIDTTSCASDTSIAGDWGDTTIAGDWGDSEMEVANRQVNFDDDRTAIAATASEANNLKRAKDLSVLSERQTKTSPITCLGKSESNLCDGLEFHPGHFVSKSASAEDLTCHSISARESVDVQHSTISTINVVPLVPKIYYNNVDNTNKIVTPNEEGDEENISIGSDTLSGVSDDFSCSLSVNHVSEDKKMTDLTSDFNLLSECAVSDGRKRPTNTPDSNYAFMHRSEMGALNSLCQSTSADLTVDATTLEPSATLANSIFNATLNESTTADLVGVSGILSMTEDKEVPVEKLVSICIDSREGDTKSSPINVQCEEESNNNVSPPEHSVDKLLKSNNSDELVLGKNRKAEDERCPSDPISVSSVTLPSFSTSQVADRSGSEVASFDIEELIRNSRRLLQNVDMTLEQSKGKSVRPVPSEDSSTSIDQSELPLDSVSVGFDTPDIPSNSTRCSNISSDILPHSKLMADNTYSSIPSIALDTSRHALKPSELIVNDNSNADQHVRNPRHKEICCLATSNNQPEKTDASVGDSFHLSDENDKDAKDLNESLENPKVQPNSAFLTLPRDSATSKEDSTNPSDVHTQIHLSAAPDEEKEDIGLRNKLPMLERQDNFENSDTTKSSFKKNTKENALDKLMKTIGINKSSNGSSCHSNDSTSISGLTMNNSESIRDISLNDSTKQSSSILSVSLDEATSCDSSQLSSDSTSGLKYCANPSDRNKGTLQRLEEEEDDDRQAQAVGNNSRPLSEPLFLLPQADRNLLMAKTERPSPSPSAVDSPSQDVLDYSGRTSINSTENYLTASIHGVSPSNGHTRPDPLHNEKCVQSRRTKSPFDERECITESFSLHTCKSEVSQSASDSNICISDSTNSTNTKCSTDVDTYTQTNSNTDTKPTNTSTYSKDIKKGSEASLSSVSSTSTSFLNNIPSDDAPPPPCNPPELFLRPVELGNCSTLARADQQPMVEPAVRKPEPAMRKTEQEARKTRLGTRKLAPAARKIAPAAHKAAPAARKISSLMGETPLLELLERHWSSAGGDDARRHLPEGLVRVWGTQVVSAMAALHGLGVVWG